ncbi:MerC domain-containing protein [Flaviaesturariibacter amylovorans]|uniref:MerC domain-containing protein n=1 Tax=Flaviaesturariibacter amylovorans TaxID=1084520 RepID=A0ABP8HNJ2_9BACT
MHPVSPQASAYRALADRIGMFASALCLVHCVLLPLALVFLPFLTLNPRADAWIEGSTLLLSAIAGTVAIGRGYRRHGHRSAAGLFGVGLGLCVLAGWSRHEGVEIAGKALGALLLIMAHLHNSRLAQRALPVVRSTQPHSL